MRDPRLRAVIGEPKQKPERAGKQRHPHRRPVREIVAAIFDEADKRGKTVSSINVDGVTATFGEVGSAKTTLTPLEAWKAKKNARQA
jgi:hypothetical protein